jgi:hypothetical protein
VAQRVSSKNEISLNGVRYKTSRDVQQVLASIYPGKVVIGDTDKDSDPRRSILAASDWRGGIGLNRLEGAGETDRAWWATTQLRFNETAILPPLATLTADQSVAGVHTVGALIDFGSEVYAAFGTTIKKYADPSDSWGSSLHTLPAVASDAITVRLAPTGDAGTVFMVFATGTGNTWTSDGSSFTDDGTDMKFITFFDKKLWGIDSVGTLRNTTNLTTWNSKATLPLETDSVSDLFTARDAGGAHVLYAATTRGLFVFDDFNNDWIQVDAMEFPIHPDAGFGTTVWRDSTYYPAGLGVYKFQNGQNAVVSIMGLDRDEGLPSDKRGVIKQLVSSHNDLLAIVDNATTGTPLNVFASGESTVIEATTGFSFIAGWNELGWEIKWIGGQTDTGIDYALVSNAYLKYRLWWASNERVFHMDLPREVINPNVVTDLNYSSAGTIELPWFNAGQDEVDKLALKLRVHVSDVTTDNTITPSFAVNLTEAWTALAEISSDGVIEYPFPDGTTQEGTEFRFFRTKADLVRGTTNTTETPILHSMTLEWRKKLALKWGFVVEVDLRAAYRGQTADEMRSDLITAVSKATLCEFTFRDDSGEDRNFFVDIVGFNGLSATGTDFTGTVSLQLAQV